MYMNHWFQSSQPFPGSMLQVTPSPRSVLSCLCISSPQGYYLLTLITAQHCTICSLTHHEYYIFFFSARNFSVILVLLKALNPGNKPHLMHWVSTAQQDFFIRIFRRNPRLEGHSCLKKSWTSLQFHQFCVNGNHLFSSKALSSFKRS